VLLWLIVAFFGSSVGVYRSFLVIAVVFPWLVVPVWLVFYLSQFAVPSLGCLLVVSFLQLSVVWSSSLHSSFQFCLVWSVVPVVDSHSSFRFCLVWSVVPVVDCQRAT
jgi:hypothetical protein